MRPYAKAAAGSAFSNRTTGPSAFVRSHIGATRHKVRCMNNNSACRSASGNVTGAALIKVARIHSAERSIQTLICALVLLLGVAGMLVEPPVAWPIATALGAIEVRIRRHHPSVR